MPARPCHAVDGGEARPRVAGEALLARQCGCADLHLEAECGEPLRGQAQRLGLATTPEGEQDEQNSCGAGRRRQIELDRLAGGMVSGASAWRSMRRWRYCSRRSAKNLQHLAAFVPSTPPTMPGVVVELAVVANRSTTEPAAPVLGSKAPEHHALETRASSAHRASRAGLQRHVELTPAAGSWPAAWPHGAARRSRHAPSDHAR